MAEEPTDMLNPMPKKAHGFREERIRRRAHEIWEAAGRPEGQDQAHWLAAESEDALHDDAEPPLGEPVERGATIPDIPSASNAVVPQADGDEPAPRTSGAPEPAPDTSKSPIANRDISGPRKAGATPRPTIKPWG